MINDTIGEGVLSELITSDLKLKVKFEIRKRCNVTMYYNMLRSKKIYNYLGVFN